MGRLAKKHLPNGVDTEYSYNEIGRIESLKHTGTSGLELSYVFGYDPAGNKIVEERKRSDIPEDSGKYEYTYDRLSRLTGVAKDGEPVRKYRYDGFGNRLSKREHMGNAVFETAYRYNENNQLIHETDVNIEKTYQYDRRGNLNQVVSGNELLQKYSFDATNQMDSEISYVDGVMRKAAYGYNGLEKRVIQSTYEGDAGIKEDELNPLKKIQYTLDLSRDYYNLLGQEEEIVQQNQRFVWDGNVVGMEQDGVDNYYLQDDLGSVLNLVGGNGESLEQLGYEEFGQVRNRNVRRAVQPFAFTGYQMDEVSGLYFAQARRYDARVGRFVSEDKVRGFVETPITLNHYGYCWNNPCKYIDKNGLFINIVVGAIVGMTFNVSARIITDIVTGHASSWQEYAGDIVGGAVFGGTGNAALAGAANGAVSTLATSGFKYVSGEKVSMKDTLIDTAVNASVGAGLGYVGGKGSLNVEGVNVGRGSCKQITKMLSTQMKNGTMLKSKSGIMGVSWKNWAKAFKWQFTDQDAGISVTMGFFNDSGLPGSAISKTGDKIFSVFSELFEQEEENSNETNDECYIM